MSFENGIFIPGPEPTSSNGGGGGPFGGSGGTGRRRGSGGGGGRRGGRSDRGSDRDRGSHHRGYQNQNQSPRRPRTRPIPALMDNGQNMDDGGAAAAESQENKDGVGGFFFNPDAPSFRPLSSVADTSSPPQQHQRHTDRSGRGGGHGQQQEFRQIRPSFNRNARGRSEEKQGHHNNLVKKDGGRRGDASTRDDAEVETNVKPSEVEVVHDVETRLRRHQPDIRNQRERLSDQLTRNAYDCMICVERIRRIGTIWSCGKCFNVFHLRCVTTWANSSKDEDGWRCPGCQSYYEDVPKEYRCFCGRVKNPEPVRSDVPHSCGQLCGKVGSGGADCDHPCPLLCHPGPCPPCEGIQTRKCCCGRISAQVKCSSKSVITCGNVCDKMLNCGAHNCSKPCHGGSCDPCDFVIQLECHCKSEKSERICNSNTSGVVTYSCGRTCDKLLACGNHNCPDQCHPGVCNVCKLSPEVVIRCPCGQTSVSEACLRVRLPQRRKCLDPIPVCGKVCGKPLPCGGKPGGLQHNCAAMCHLSSHCPVCPLLTSFKCRCGSKTFELSCAQYDPEKEYRCEKRCTKKKSCGRHKCNVKCCMDEDHICLIVCDRPLRCGNHNCVLLCHNGHCPPCRVVSFHELDCECGASVIYPPIPCGAKRPPCTSPCSRNHDCDHPVMHHCHSDPQCPPCTMFTEKWCHGKHVLRKNVMCHIKQVSCGMPCKKMLSCGRHECTRPCHPDECLPQGQRCQMACEIPKAECGHVCGSPCHNGPCPDTKCKVVSEVACPCGRKQETMVCWKREKEYDRLVCYVTNLELKQLRNALFDDVTKSSAPEPEINAEAILTEMQRKTPKANVLECDKECSRVERNRKMMEALQLEDPDATSTFGTPNYSEFLISFAKKNPQFVENVHDRLTNLVVKAKRSKRKNETFGFESMNRDKRRLVHEYSDHFGCLSESFDEEPNRNIVCTASKDKSYLPAVSLVDAVFRPNICSERKNTFNDVDIFQNTKSQIMRPANVKMWSMSSTSPSQMVPLVPSTTIPPNSNFNFAYNANSTVSTPRNFTTTTTSALHSLPGADFPPLS